MPLAPDIRATLAMAAHRSVGDTYRAQGGAAPPGGPQGVFDLNGEPVVRLVTDGSIICNISEGEASLSAAIPAISVTSFGADPTGVLDSSDAFLQALQVAAGRPVTFDGTFKIISTIEYTGKVTLIGNGKTSRILSDMRVFGITNGSDSVFDNFYMENLTAPWIITRNPDNWGASVTPTQSNGNGYQPTVNDADIWGSLTTEQKNQDIGPKIYMNGDTNRVRISRIYGRFVTVFLQGAVDCTVEKCEFRAGKDGINFWNIDANAGSGNKALNNRITYAGFSGIAFARNTNGVAKWNDISLCGESGIKTWQGVVSSQDARCYQMTIDNNRCVENYFDGIDSTADNPRTTTIDTRHDITENRCVRNRRTGVYGDGQNNRYIGNRTEYNGLSGLKILCTLSKVDGNFTRSNNASNTGSGEHEIAIDGDDNVISNNQMNKNTGVAGYALSATGTNRVSLNIAKPGVNYFGAVPTATLLGNHDDNG